jgi:NAD(P) transhydrogenase
VLASSEDFDLIVIGCGPAGEKAGAQAAYFDKRVAVIEGAEYVGGSCINTGTVPSKTLRESALYFSGLKQRGLYGIDYSLKENLTINDFMHHEREVVEMERQRILKNLALHHIELVRGWASFEDAHTVSVSGANGIRQLRGDVILISTGSKPHRPSEIAFDDVRVFDSDTFLQMDRIPHSLAVIGGGVIGCEYASIFAALGVQVTLVDGRDRLLPFLDAEISERLRVRLAAIGMTFWFKERPVKVESTASDVQLVMKSGKTLQVESALFAAGRRAAVDGLSLEKVGLDVNERGYISVDEHYRTCGAKYLRSGRRHRISGAGFDVDGTRTRRRVPCFRFQIQAASRLDAADGDLYHPGDLRRGRDGRIMQRERDRLLCRAGSLCQQRPGPHHRRHRGNAETGLRARR